MGLTNEHPMDISGRNASKQYPMHQATDRKSVRCSGVSACSSLPSGRHLVAVKPKKNKSTNMLMHNTFNIITAADIFLLDLYEKRTCRRHVAVALGQ